MADENDLPEGSKKKLIRAKEQWARDGRLLTGKSGAQRLPPGQHLVKDWPVLDIGIQPAVSRDEWRLTIDGAVENPLRWNWRDYMSQLQTKLITDIHCVTAWSRYDNNWEGVLAQTILAEVRPKAEVRHVIFHSHDSYTTNVTLEDFAAPDVIVAHSWEGQPLSTAHGGPVRIMLPRRYLWKSAKWVRRIEFSATDKPGFWENRGYHNEADPWTEERYS